MSIGSKTGSGSVGRGWKAVEKKKKAASCTKQPIPTQKSIKPKKVEVVAIKAEDNRLLLLVGNETIEISDYRTESAANGATKLHVTIVGETVSTELLANSKK